MNITNLQKAHKKVYSLCFPTFRRRSFWLAKYNDRYFIAVYQALDKLCVHYPIEFS